MGGSKVRRFRYGCPLLSAGSPLSAPILAQHALRSLRLFMAHDAKHLFVVANVAGAEQRLIGLRRTLVRPRGFSGGTLSNPPYLSRGYPSRIKLGVPKIYKIQKSRRL